MMIGVVYSKKQKVRRRLIICDSSQLEIHKNELHEKEGWLEIPDEIYCSFQNSAELDQYIASIIGLRASDKCCVVCPVRGVLGTVHADPEIDIHPEGKIVDEKNIKPTLLPVTETL